MAALPRKWVSGGAPTLRCTSARRGLAIDEVAVPVSFTVETTVLPSFALRAIRISGGFIVLA